MEDKHYVCKGDCGTVTKNPATCAADGCSRNGKELAECNCNDGEHKEVTATDSE